MPEMIEELQKIGEKIDESIIAVKAAQDLANEAKTLAGGVDERVTKASEDAAKNLSELQDLTQKVESIEKTAEYIEKAVARMGSGGGDTEQTEMEQKAREETSRYLRTGAPMSADTASAVVRALVTKNIVGLDEDGRELQIKTLLAGVNPSGGYFIRPERSASMIQRIFETSPVRNHANIETTNSDTFEIVIDDDEATSGGWVGEVSSRGDTDNAEIGLLTIPIHEQFAQPKASQKMLDDAGFDIEAWHTRKVTNKMTRTENTAFVNGDGSQKPRGFLALPAWAAAGVYERFKIEQVNSGVSAEFTGDGIKALQNSLIEAYQGSAIFGVKRASFTQIVTLKDGQGAYLLNPLSLAQGDDKILLGKEVVFMDDIPAVAADALAMVYGDFSVGYTIVDRIGFRVIRDEVTAKPFIKFYTTKRTGGDVTNYEALKIQKLAA